MGKQISDAKFGNDVFVPGASKQYHKNLELPAL
jgi:hypothetical protein